MTPPPPDPEGSWSPRPLETPTRILDPRFRYLLSLPFTELRDRQRREWEMLEPLQGEIRDESRRLRTTSTPAERAPILERLRDLGRKRFSPVTAGVHIPDPSAGTGMWAPGMQEVYFSAFILTDTNAAGLGRLGVRPRTRSGDVFTAFIPRSSIEKLEASAAVRGVELARPLFQSLFDTIDFTEIDQLHGSLYSTVDGTGVVIGVVDDYLDLFHPAFQTRPDDAPVKSRVRFLWDQNRAPAPTGGDFPVAVDPPLPGFALTGDTPAGVEWPDESATAGRHTINWELDPDSPLGAHVRYEIVSHNAYDPAPPFPFHSGDHGTKVTGCAAGNDGGQPGVYPVGAAPAADIIFVSYREEAHSMALAENTAVMDGCNYIFLRAAELGGPSGKPCVINLSLNDNLGSHDGMSGCERYLDGMLAAEPRRVVTVSAGNSNDHDCHTDGRIAAGDTAQLELLYTSIANPKSDAAEIWYDEDGDFHLTVHSRDAAGAVRLEIENLAPSPTASASVVLPGGAKLTVTSTLQDPWAWHRAKRIAFLITVNAGETIPDLLISLKNNGNMAGFHGWVDRNNESGSAWLPAMKRLTLAPPATAQFVIAVGAHLKTDPPTIADYSGLGPTRDPRPLAKPEILTVGGEETVAGGMTVPKAHDPSLGAAAAFSDLYTASQSGTSLAAPVVAGACALLFQCRGYTGAAADILLDLLDPAGTVGTDRYLLMSPACAGAPAMPMWLGLNASDLEFVIPLPEPPPINPRWWVSPDIRVVLDPRKFRDNPIPLQTTTPGHRVQITLRNASRKELKDVAVEFYWADLATGLLSISDWKKDGVSFPGPRGALVPGNRMPLDRIPARSEVEVEFRWVPPARGSGPRATGSFSLLARVVHAAAPARSGAPRTVRVGMGSAVALRSVVVGKLGAKAKGTMDFLVGGSEGSSSLIVATQGAKGEVALRVPIAALPWRDLEVLKTLRGPRSAYRKGGPADPLARMRKTLAQKDIPRVTDVTGADSLRLSGGFATLVASPGRPLRIPDLRVAPGEQMPVRLEIRNARLAGPRGFVHVAQYSRGRAAGGVSLELRA